MMAEKFQWNTEEKKITVDSWSKISSPVTLRSIYLSVHFVVWKLLKLTQQLEKLKNNQLAQIKNYDVLSANDIR